MSSGGWKAVLEEVVTTLVVKSEGEGERGFDSVFIRLMSTIGEMPRHMLGSDSSKGGDISKGSEAVVWLACGGHRFAGSAGCVCL